MRLHFIRHTRPDIARGVCYGQSDIPLASSFPEKGALPAVSIVAPSLAVVVSLLPSATLHRSWMSGS